MALRGGFFVALAAAAVAGCSSSDDRVACAPCAPPGIYIDASQAVPGTTRPDSAQICVDGSCSYERQTTSAAGRVPINIILKPGQHISSLIITIFDGVHPLATLQAGDLTMPSAEKPRAKDPCACLGPYLDLRFDPGSGTLIRA